MFYAFAMISMNKILNLNLFNCGHHKSVNICIVKNFLNSCLNFTYIGSFNVYISANLIVTFSNKPAYTRKNI